MKLVNLKWLVLLTLCLLYAQQAVASLPVQMVGEWQGSPEYSVLGPWGHHLFNFSVQAWNNSDNVWLMSDYFQEGSAFIPRSQQQWWVKEGEGLTYCGMARSFWALRAPIYSNFTESFVTENQIQWCHGGCDAGVWTLTLLDENTLQSEFYYDSPVVHLNVTLHRISSPMPMVARSIEFPQPYPCNLTLGPIPRKPSLVPRGCPFAHNTSQSIGSRLDDLSRSHPRDSFRVPQSLLSQYKFCYVLNPAVQFALAWNFDERKQQLEMAISMPSSQAAKSWIALGFQPTFPGMIDADVAMGYMTSSGPCVRGMYVPHYVGAPVDNAEFVLTNTTVRVDSDRLTVQFTRSFTTGHHPIREKTYPYQGMRTMWASGPAPSSCTGTPVYHGNTRGLIIIDWRHPEAVLSSSMQCQGQ